jgi:TP901-1 family phage major tail protein
MSGQKGRDVLVRVGDGAVPERFVAVAGLRARTIRLSAGNVDATSADSPEGWRELIAGAGVKSAQVRGAGVFKDAQSDALMRAAFFAGRAVNLELVIPDFATLSGPFVIESLSYGGEHDGEATIEMGLASAGLIGFTVLA